MTPIQTLIAKVEAGEATFHTFISTSRAPLTTRQTDMAYRAYSGSLDAAISLLEAVLPGWGPTIDLVDGEVSMYRCISTETDEWEWMFDVRSETPARALLLCILKAMEDGE